MVNYRDTGLETIIEQVQIIDLENAAHLPEGRCIKGMLAGNDGWRSPEGHFKGELSKPSGIFSFAAMVSSFIYRGYLANLLSVSMQCSDKLSSGQMRIYEDTNRKVLSLMPFGCNVKFPFLEIEKD